MLKKRFEIKLKQTKKTGKLEKYYLTLDYETRYCWIPKDRVPIAAVASSGERNLSSWWFAREKKKEKRKERGIAHLICTAGLPVAYALPVSSPVEGCVRLTITIKLCQSSTT